MVKVSKYSIKSEHGTIIRTYYSSMIRSSDSQVYYEKGLCIPGSPALCVAPGPGPRPWPPAPAPGPGPQFVFAGPSPRVVFTSPGSKFVFTGAGLQFYCQCGA